MSNELNVKTPLEKLWQWETERPNQVYISQPKDGKWIDYTWKDVANEVRKMAGALNGLGYGKGDKIASLSKNDAYWILSDLAIMAAGCISVPMYPNLSSKSVNQILTHSGAKALFVGKLDTWNDMKDGVPSDIQMISTPLWGPKVGESWEDLTQKYDAITTSPTPDKDELASIIYTSGTTGLPKGVMHKYLNFSYAATHALADLKIDPKGEKFFSYLPLCHIAERLLVEMGSIYCGGTVYFAETLESFPDNLRHAQPTVFLAVPRIWEKFRQGILGKMPQEKLSRLLKIPIIKNLVKKRIRGGLGLTQAKNVFSGAAPIAVSLVEWYETLGINIQEAYAMTENCCYSHATRNNAIKIGAVGQPLRYVDVKIDASNDEILIKHPALMEGYYRDEAKTAETFKDGYLKTGDQGRVDSDGFLYITGRVKDLFKTDKGKYIAPSPIELKISGNPLVEQVILIGMGVPMPIALICLSEEGLAAPKAEVEKSLEATIASVNKTLDHHENVDTYIILNEGFSVENGLLTPTMKIKRIVVEKKYMEEFRKWYDLEGRIVWES